jgi:molybdenum storage protein
MDVTVAVRGGERFMKNDVLTELGRSLIDRSLTDPQLLAQTRLTPLVRILPDANVVKIGGQSIIDRGRSAVFPLVDEIVQNLSRHKMILGTGAGTRARHAYSVGIDLGLPTGVLSVLGTFVSIQNARMLAYLLARHGIPFLEVSEFPQLPQYLEECGAAVIFGMPPYTYFLQNPQTGRIPPHRTDTGVFLVSEVFGARAMIYVKDENGLFTADPKKDKNAKLIPKISLSELAALDLNDVVVERAVLDFMSNAEHTRQIQVINGLVPSNLTRALEGEPIGTIITAD